MANPAIPVANTFNLIVGDTAAKISTAGTQINADVQLRAHPVNGAGGYIYIGYDDAVTANGDGTPTDGIPLGPGDSYDVPRSKLTTGIVDNIWAIGSTTGLILCVDPN